jgi:DNA-binding transcriptional ArsR family regulator
MIDPDPRIVDQCRRIASTWSAVLRALAKEERLLIVLWLAESECSVRELEKVTGLSQSLVSYHLAELRKAGLVVASSEGRSNRYRLAGSELDQLSTVIGRLSASDVH